MLKFSTNKLEIENKLLNEIKLFFYDLDADIEISHIGNFVDNICENIVIIDNKQYKYTDNVLFNNEVEQVRFRNRTAKKSIYRALSDFTGKSHPWGSLTGIRPTKIGYEYLSMGNKIDGMEDYLISEYNLFPEKAKLVKDIIVNQSNYHAKDDNLYNFYVHIPYCTSKCSYCSFITFDALRCKKQIPQYCDDLVREIVQSQNYQNEYGNKMYSAYVGGGTPTALDAEQLYKVLSAIKTNGVEFTCEAGRPDTITNEKLAVMKECGVTRVCVNPQSFNEKTLRLIGRNHTIDDFYAKYEMVKSYGFDINIDLIAGLPEESIDDFIFSVNSALKLNPENLTIHTLSRKNGSELKNSGKYDNFDIEQMIKYSSSVLPQNDYLPYYLYRQKSMLGNLENTGYCKNGKQCINNITTMEEFLSVDACGAGAISKRVFSGENRIERLANLRDVKLYIEQFDERLEKKRIFYKK